MMLCTSQINGLFFIVSKRRDRLYHVANVHVAERGTNGARALDKQGGKGGSGGMRGKQGEKQASGLYAIAEAKMRESGGA